MKLKSKRFDGCIDKAIASGKLDKEHGAQLREQRDALLSSRPMDADQNVLVAAARSLDTDDRRLLLQITRQTEALSNITDHPEGIATGLMSLLGRDITGKAKYGNIDARTAAITQHVSSMLAEIMQALRPTALGLRQNRPLARRIAKELHGQSTGDAQAKTFATQLGQVMEYLRQRFNRAGGAIAKRRDFGLPQMHDPLSVSKAGRNEWKAFVIPRLDRARMYDDAGQPLSAKELDRRLDEVYHNIVTPGLGADKALGGIGQRSLANTRRDQRHLTFRDGDTWLEYFDQFGGKDIYGHITDHLQRMSADIANMELLGPNPEASFQYLRNAAIRDGLKGIPLQALDALWRVVSGRADDSASLSWADRMTGIRNFLTSAKLGSAMLSSVSDLAFIRQTAAWNDLKATRIIRSALSNLNPKNKADRLRAVKMGLVADHWMNRALAANRFTEVTGAGMTAQLADFTMRASGLSAWTDSAQKAVGMEVMTRLAEVRALPLKDLSEDLRSVLELAGFDERDWQILRTTAPDSYKGVDQVYLANLTQRKDLSLEDRERVATKLLELTYAMTNSAIPTPDARVRAITTFGRQRGTLGGEAMRTIAQFKSFPVSVVLQHVYRGIYQSSGVDRASYLASLTIATTVMGALAVQLKEIAKGRNPREMDTPDFWTSAFTQGGGAGIFGDFIYAGTFGSNRFGSSLAETLGGPVAGLATDAARLTVGQAGELVSGDDNNLGSDLAFAMRRYTPAIGSLWYTRLAYERAVIDQLQLELDPKAPSKFRREESRRAREQNQGYWWRRGKTLPESAQ